MIHGLVVAASVIAVAIGRGWKLPARRTLSRALALAGLLLVTTAAIAGEVTLYAAASLTAVLTELSDSYQKQHPDIVIKRSFAASSTLARQIENGAPAELFISADSDWGDYLEQRGLLLTATRKNLLRNELVLIAPTEQPVELTLDRSFDFSASFSGHLCTGEPDHVPVGKYAKQALSHYGWWDGIASRVVGTEDVRTVVAFVERGECALGIVYQSDAMNSKKVSVTAIFPSASHLPIIYPGGLLKGADADAARFWDYLRSDEAKAVFVRYGFSVES